MNQTITARFIVYSHGQPAPMDLSTDVDSIKVGKDIGQPAGQWQVSLRGDRRDYRQILADDDWVLIQISSDGQTYSMLGLIDSIRRTKTMSGRKAQVVTYRLSGTDFSKCFIKSNLVFNGLLRGIPSIYSTELNTLLRGEVSALSQPGLLIKKYISYLMNYGYTAQYRFWRLPDCLLGNSQLIDLVDIDTFLDTEHITGSVSDLFALIDVREKTTIDSYIRPFTNEPWNEYFYDCRRVEQSKDGTETYADGRSRGEGELTPSINRRVFSDFVPAIVFRPRPYTRKEYWGALRLHKIDAEEVTVEDLGKTGDERINYVMVVPFNPFLDKAGLRESIITGSGADMPILDLDSVEKHGLRMLDTASHHVSLQTGQFLPEVIAAAQDLCYAYGNIHDQYTGTLTLRHVRPEVQLGERCEYDGYEYYITGYAYDVRMSDRKVAQAEQSVMVTHGVVSEFRTRSLYASPRAALATTTSDLYYGAEAAALPGRFPELPERWTEQAKSLETGGSAVNIIGFRYSKLSIVKTSTAVTPPVTNDPLSSTYYANARQLARNLCVLQTALGAPIPSVYSGYRSPAYNAAIGGSPTSQHLLALAIDFAYAGLSAGDVYDTIRQLILEGKMSEGGIGYYPHGNYLHYDCRGSQERWIQPTAGATYTYTDNSVTYGAVIGNLAVPPYTAIKEDFVL